MASRASCYITPYASRITREIGGHRVTIDYHASEVHVSRRKADGDWGGSSLVAFDYFRANAHMHPERVFDLVERQLR